MKIPNVIRTSNRARECLEEIRVLASGDPQRVETALLPKTRQFLSYLQSEQSSLRDAATQPEADPKIPAMATIIPPAADLPNTIHGRGNQVDAILAYEMSVEVPPTNNLGGLPVINEAPPAAPPSMLGSSGSVRTVGEAPLLHVGTPYPAHIPTSGTSFSIGRTIFPNLAPAFHSAAPDHEVVSYSENWNPTVPDSSHSAVDYGDVGPIALYPHFNVASHETRDRTSGNGINWDGGAVSLLRDLAWDMGYCLIPRGACISDGGNLASEFHLVV
ncbi:uncharacterized protein EI90DRAFT_3078776 [Cantharellus anzutake]|uniref:uncharacterized protein n=1 Tax=Cantharellus anzutake TaxID=1750568 RepID=UPI001908EAA6|nr:uncharacterized protein EI90DRAFT_3078776 [Cantharellus anzutake]KAF8321837.1 hypothetical protein EI90DRAFT_3078776 [Cantharellus anzutake]